MTLTGMTPVCSERATLTPMWRGRRWRRCEEVASVADEEPTWEAVDGRPARMSSGSKMRCVLEVEGCKTEQILDREHYWRSRELRACHLVADARPPVADAQPDRLLALTPN